MRSLTKAECRSSNAQGKYLNKLARQDHQFVIFMQWQGKSIPFEGLAFVSARNTFISQQPTTNNQHPATSNQQRDRTLKNGKFTVALKTHPNAIVVWISAPVQSLFGDTDAVYRCKTVATYLTDNFVPELLKRPGGAQTNSIGNINGIAGR